MKKFIAFIVIIALAVIFIPRLHVAGADNQSTTVNVYDQQRSLVKSVVFAIGMNQYFTNGQTQGIKMDVAPFIQSDRTFVPVRFLGNALGLSDNNITWDNTTQTATLKSNVTLQMTVGKPQIVSNSQVKAIDVAPVLTSDRTFLPGRFVAEGLGYQVDWDETTQTVICWPQGQPKPDVSSVQQYVQQVQAGQQPMTQPQQPAQPTQPQQPTVSQQTGGGWTGPRTVNGLPIDTGGMGKNGGGGPDTTPVTRKLF